MAPYVNQKTSNERIERARKKLVGDPYDIESWKILVKDAKSKSIDSTRDFFEKLVNQFPNYGKFWKFYIEAEIQSKNYERAEKLFQRSLIKILNIDLWICYLSYVKEAKANQLGFKEKLAQAFEFALDKVGLDVKSYPIWAAQLEFLKGVEAVGSYAENQRIAAVRKIYHRACTTPVHNVELLWRDYIAYEQGINPLIAKKMIDEHSKDYMNARRALKEMEAICRGLDRNSPAIPLRHTLEESKQVDIWRKYLRWEKSNPLNSDDINYVIKRVTYGYEQALLSLSHRPEAWIDAVKYMENGSKILFERGDISGGKVLLDRMSETLDRSTSTFFQTNMLMHFYQADFEETRENHSKVEDLYAKLLNPNNVTHELDYSLIYIQYMRYARRTTGIKGARVIFKKARDDIRTKHEIYTCAALMEYYCSKDKNIALKIFELGLKKYSTHTAYLEDYIDFLQSLNDDNNTRVLFERLLNSIGPQVSQDKTIKIWNRFLDFEIEVGDLANIHKVDQRRIAACNMNSENPDKSLTLLIDRFRYRDLLPYRTEAAISSDKIENVQNNTSSSVICMPDENQMLPFKPQKSSSSTQNFIVPGGIFAIPPALSSLLNSLPPSNLYTGPFVMVDQLISLLNSWNEYDSNKDVVTVTSPLTPRQSSSPYASTSPRTAGTLGHEELSSISDLKKRSLGSTGIQKKSILAPKSSPLYQSIISINSTNNKKRSNPAKVEEEENDLEDISSSIIPPINDIYRLRQQKKIK